MNYLDSDQTIEKMRPRGVRDMRVTRLDKTRGRGAREETIRRREVRALKSSARLTSR